MQSRNYSTILKGGLIDRFPSLGLPVSEKNLIQTLDFKFAPTSSWTAFLLFYEHSLPIPMPPRGVCIPAWCPWALLDSSNAGKL